MGTTTLAQEIAIFLTPFLPYLLKAGKGASEGIGERIGALAWEHARALWSKLWPAIKAKPAAQKAVEDVATLPQDRDKQAELCLQLKEILSEDKALTAEVAHLWEEAQSAGVTVIAWGNRSAAVGGFVSGNTIITGDKNVVQQGRYNISIGQAENLSIGAQDTAVGVLAARTPPFMVPPLPPQGVLGRDEDLARLSELLALDDDQATDVSPVALRGMGGVGKTTLSIALGRLEVVRKLFPDGVLWVALGPNPAIRILLDGWGRSLGVDLLPERNEKACRDRLRAVLYHRRVLLIVDDVWEVAHGQYFTVAGPHCRTLVTTRETPVAYTLATRARTLRVDVLKPEAALALLRRLAPEAVLADEQNAIRLCERLEFLPLALTLAGRLLASEADVPTRMQRILGELIERRESRLQLLQAEGRLGLAEDQPVSLHAILGMSVERLSKTDQERFAMLAVFGGEPLTWEINAAAYVWECSVEEAEATISRFIQRGLVERRGERYWMHALLADYATEMMEKMGV